MPIDGKGLDLSFTNNHSNRGRGGVYAVDAPAAILPDTGRGRAQTQDPAIFLQSIDCMRRVHTQEPALRRGSFRAL
jgi:hypothetical protein